MLKSDLYSFLDSAISVYHTSSRIREYLLSKGFYELREDEVFSINRGGKYFVIRNSCAVIAFTVPENFDSFSIISSHIDSPTFKVKVNPMIKKVTGNTLNVEPYGGMLVYSFFDRPSDIAGRFFVLEDGKVCERLFSFSRPVCSLVSLAIHQNRKANEGLSFSMQNEVQPLLSLPGGKDDLLEVAADILKVKKDQILSYDLFLANTEKAQEWGLNREFFSSARIDDLSSAYLSIRALSECESGKRINIAALFNNEEVGSSSNEGALSTFLSDTISRISSALDISDEERLVMYSKSLIISSDNAHAKHPCFESKSDVTNTVRLNGGVVIKYSANLKYTTDAYSAACVKALMIENKIKYQEFVNNSDVPGGSTLGNLSLHRAGIPTCDVGMPQLAMHSSYETAGVDDIESMYRLFCAFYKKR